jgi:hypothetical protein
VYSNHLKSKLLILLISIFLFVGQASSQPWLNYASSQKKQGEEPGFYEIQYAFKSYWKNKKPAKGKGYKQFKRWEAFIVPRIYPNGDFQADKSWSEYQRIKSSKFKSTFNSNWAPIGPSIVPDDNNGEPSGVGRVNCIAFHPTNANIIFFGSTSWWFLEINKWRSHMEYNYR